MESLISSMFKSKVDDEDEKHESEGQKVFTTPVYAAKWDVQFTSRNKLPKDGMPSQATYQLIRDELALDSDPTLNLASFITTYMEKEATDLIVANMSKNFVDGHQYPMTHEIEQRCVGMIARLFHAPVKDEKPSADTLNVSSPPQTTTIASSATLSTSPNVAVGTSTIGSSEALFLAVLALKRRWQLRQNALGRSGSTPNIVMSSGVQVCAEKAARYLDLESRFVFFDPSHYLLNPERAVELVDENTIGIICILGSTYTGGFENVARVNDLLQERNTQNGWDVRIHVDAASGGFVAPFVAPGLVWDFRLPLVDSINVSGHKYGFCYPGIGWVVWRNKYCLPEDLIFHIDYLGSSQVSYTLNFSKSAALVIAQYYMFLRLGFQGYKSILDNIYGNCRHFVAGLQRLGYFQLLADSHHPDIGLPVVTFRLKKESLGSKPPLSDDTESGGIFGLHFNEYDISRHLQQSKWIVPAFTLAKNAQDITLLRVVMREDFSQDRGDLLLKQLKLTVEELMEHDAHAIAVFRKSWKGQQLTSIKQRQATQQFSFPSIC